MNGCFRALVPKVMLFSIFRDYLEVDIKWSMIKFAADPRSTCMRMRTKHSLMLLAF